MNEKKLTLGGQNFVNTQNDKLIKEELEKKKKKIFLSKQ